MDSVSSRRYRNIELFKKSMRELLVRSVSRTNYLKSPFEGVNQVKKPVIALLAGHLSDRRPTGSNRFLSLKFPNDLAYDVV
jgi:hypothetical protein